MAHSAEALRAAPSLARFTAWTWYPWAVLGASFLVQTSASFGFRGLSPLAPFLVDDLELTRNQFGLVLTATTIGTTLTLALAGSLSDRFGVRALFLLSLLASGLSLGLASAAPTYTWLLAAMALFGLGFGFALPPTTRAIVEWFPRRRRGLAMGIKQTGLAFGGVICGLVVPPLSLTFGWRGAMLALATATIAAGFIAWLVYRDPETKASTVHAQRATFTSLLRDRNLLILSGVTWLYAAVQLSILGFLVLYLRDSVGLATATAGLLLAVVEAGGVAGRVGWGVVSDMLFGGRRRVVLGIIGVLSAASCLALAALDSSTPMLVVVAVLGVTGVSVVGWNGINMTFVAEIAGRQNSATAAGMNLTASYLGVMLGPPLFGLVVDTTGAYATAFQLSALASAVALALLWWVRPTTAS